MNDVAEPLDYEDFLSQYQLLIDRDPLRTMLDFPQNYLEVQIIKRPIRTLQPIMPEETMLVTPNILNTVSLIHSLYFQRHSSSSHPDVHKLLYIRLAHSEVSKQVVEQQRW